VLKPIALKGLSFITNRSRSAPPTPRAQKLSLSVPGSPPRTTSPLAGELGSLQITPLTAALEDAGEVTGHGPSIVVEQVIDSPTPPTVPAEGHEAVDTAKSKLGGLVPPASAVPGSVVGSRSASPAPSLEAILLDRKRRLAAAGAQSSQSTIPITSPIPTTEIRPSNPRMATPSMKGTRFKSSPRGGFDRHGVVVAEQVKAGIRSQDVSQEDVRIPDDKDKVGPDKMEGGDGS
jgi:metal transporter CNNM